MSQPPFSQQEVPVAEQTPARGRFQFSLRTLCLFVMVLAFLLALPSLLGSLARTIAYIVWISYLLAMGLIWASFLVVTVIHLFAWLFSERGERTSFGMHWLQLAVVAVLTLTPIFAALAQHEWERRLPNGFYIVSEEYGDHLWIANPQGRQIVPAHIIKWRVNGDVVVGETDSGIFFALDTVTGEKLLSEDAEEIRRFVEEAEAGP